MAGCDYMPSIHGIGIKKGVDYIYRYGDIKTAIKYLRSDKKFRSRVIKIINYYLKIFQTFLFRFQMIMKSVLKKFLKYSCIKEFMTQLQNK